MTKKFNLNEYNCLLEKTLSCNNDVLALTNPKVFYKIAFTHLVTKLRDNYEIIGNRSICGVPCLYMRKNGETYYVMMECKTDRDYIFGDDFSIEEPIMKYELKDKYIKRAKKDRTIPLIAKVGLYNFKKYDESVEVTIDGYDLYANFKLERIKNLY